MCVCDLCSGGGLWSRLELGDTEAVECLELSELLCVNLDNNAERCT